MAREEPTSSGPSSRSRVCACQWTSCSSSHPPYHHFHHHHYPLILFPHHHHLFLCPHHNHHHHHRRHLNCHGYINATFAPVATRNPQLVGVAPLQNTFNVEAEATPFEDAADHSTRILQEQGLEGLEEVEEDDEDPIFVLTDEWTEFFAKSEAKRKLAKKQPKKK